MKERADPTQPHYGSDLVNVDGLSKDCALLNYGELTLGRVAAVFQRVSRRMSRVPLRNTIVEN